MTFFVTISADLGGDFDACCQNWGVAVLGAGGAIFAALSQGYELVERPRAVGLVDDDAAGDQQELLPSSEGSKALLGECLEYEQPRGGQSGM